MKSPPAVAQAKEKNESLARGWQWNPGGQKDTVPWDNKLRTVGGEKNHKRET